MRVTKAVLILEDTIYGIENPRVVWDHLAEEGLVVRLAGNVTSMTVNTKNDEKPQEVVDNA